MLLSFLVSNTLKGRFREDDFQLQVTIPAAFSRESRKVAKNVVAVGLADRATVQRHGAAFLCHRVIETGFVSGLYPSDWQGNER